MFGTRKSGARERARACVKVRMKNCGLSSGVSRVKSISRWSSETWWLSGLSFMIVPAGHS